MATWAIFQTVTDLLVINVFGSYLFLGLFLMFGLMALLLAARVSPAISLMVGLPYFISLITAGWFGEIAWLKSVLVLIAAIIWGFVLWRMIE